MMFKKFFLVKCNRTLARMIENRASELGLTIPEYLKYLTINDIENVEMKKSTNEICKDGEDSR